MTKTFKFEFSEEQANLLLTALGEMPAKQSYGMIQEIHRQVAEQQRPAKPLPEDPERDEQGDDALKALEDDGT